MPLPPGAPKLPAGKFSDALAKVAEANKKQNPPVAILAATLVGPVKLFDTLPSAISQSARDCRKQIARNLNNPATNDPEKLAGILAYALTFPGEGFAQFGNAEG